MESFSSATSVRHLVFYYQTYGSQGYVELLLDFFQHYNYKTSKKATFQED